MAISRVIMTHRAIIGVLGAGAGIAMFFGGKAVSEHGWSFSQDMITALSFAAIAIGLFLWEPNKRAAPVEND